MMTQVAIVLLLLVQFVVIIFAFVMLTLMVMAIVSVPWVPTPRRIGRKMFEMAELKPGETVVDFGCGDASLLITAAKEFGARGIGFELHPVLRWVGLLRARLAGVSDRIDLRGGSFYRVDLPEADVIATYLFAEVQAKLEPRFKEHYPSGTRVIARTFRYPTLPLVKTERLGGENLYLYRIP